MIKYSCDWSDQEQKLAIITACQNHPLIVQVFSQEIMALHRSLSELSEAAATEASDELAEETSEGPSTPMRSPAADVKILLAEIDGGNSKAWPKLIWVMRFNEDGSEGAAKFNPDLNTYPGWQHSAASTQARIVAAAGKYLLEQDAKSDKWLGTNTIGPAACAGYKAMRLLYEENRAFLQGLEDHVWKKWAPIFFSYVLFCNLKAEELPIHEALAEMTYRHAPDEVVTSIGVEVGRDHAYVLEALKSCWDDRLGEALLNKAKELQTRGRSISGLLDKLLARNATGAREFAESLLKSPLPTGYSERQRIITTADLLMQHADDAAWPVVWPLVQGDPAWGQELIERQADLFRRHNDNDPPIPNRLTEDQLAELYIWMIRKYPPSEDPLIKGPHSPSSRELIGQWRDSILTHLRNRGTAAACAAIDRITKQFPDLKSIKEQLLEAQAIHRHRSWRPPLTAEILRMAGERRKFLAQPQANSGYSDMDARIAEIAGEVRSSLSDVNGEHINAFVIVLGALANFLRINLQQAIYKEGVDVSESEFQQKILYHLRMRLGEGVMESPRQGGGPTDVKYRSVTVELKVEKKISDRQKIVEKYFSQPTQYSSADGAQLGILCILDLTTKQYPPANPKNQISLWTPPIHGFPNKIAPFPTKIASIFIDGNLRLPSDYSR